MNQQFSPSIEIVLIKEEIAENCVLQDGNVLQGKKTMAVKDINTLENLENVNNMQYSSSLCEEDHIENFLKRVKKETAFNLVPEEIQIKDERLFEATDSDSDDKSNNKLLNDETNKPDNFNDKHSTADEGKLSSIDCNYNNNNQMQLNYPIDDIDFQQNKKISKNYNFASSEGGKIYGFNYQNVDCARRHKCDQCHKTFYKSGHLQTHSRIHTGEKPYECDICHKKFKQMNNLTVHKRIHNNERPFKCSVCHNSFIQKNHLSQHMRIHSGEKLFQCQFCQYTCGQNGDLKRHMRIHTGEKPFMCMHCKKAFNQSHSLKSHIRTQHSDKI